MTGFDIGPLCQDAASTYDVPLVGLLALLKAESGLNPHAERYGAWPDVSFGLGQQVVAYAPFGDGSDSAENIAFVRDKLFDRATAIQIAAAHLKSDYATAKAAGDDSVLGGLVVYNCGHYPVLGGDYWTRYAGNVENYKMALAWAEQVTS